MIFSIYVVTCTDCQGEPERVGPLFKSGGVCEDIEIYGPRSVRIKPELN